MPGGPAQSRRLVVSAVRGGVVDAKDFNKDWWKPALRAVGVPCGTYEDGMHKLRHFFASVLLDQGESTKLWPSGWATVTHRSPSRRTHLIPSSADGPRA
ncbi:MAG: hypothetical protein M3300_12390 [Actinomycetota bacterium]|nr:hypothetical protein [Actinomycetota bacterium]